MSENGINRRGLLKKTGVAATGVAGITAFGTGTTAAASYSSVNVHVYDLDGTASYSSLFDARDAIENLLAQIGDYVDRIPRRYSGTFSYSVDVQYNSLVEEFSDVDDVTNQACKAPSVATDIYNSEEDAGADIIFVVKSNGKWASVDGVSSRTDGVDDDDPVYGAWGDQVVVPWAGAEGGYDEAVDDTKRFQNAVIQETAHTLINNEHIDGNESHGEHELGKIREDGSSTPLITFYESTDANVCSGPDHDALGGDHTGEGDCSSDAEWDGTVTKEITRCTRGAIYETHRKDGF